jgi:hypothetical protein
MGRKVRGGAGVEGEGGQVRLSRGAPASASGTSTAPRHASTHARTHARTHAAPMPAHLDLAHCARDDGLEHRAAVVVQEVDLVDDHQAHQLGGGAVACGQEGQGWWGGGAASGEQKAGAAFACQLTASIKSDRGRRWSEPSATTSQRNTAPSSARHCQTPPLPLPVSQHHTDRSCA